MEKGRVFETDKKIETNKGESWIKEILIPLWDGSSDASGILAITWDYTSEKICDLEKEKMQKEIEDIIATLIPVFSNLSQGKFDEKINIPEDSNFNDLYNTGNLALDNLRQLKEGLENKINQKNEEIELSKTELANMKNEIEQNKEIISKKDSELELKIQELNNIQSELEKEKEKNNQKEQELEQEKQKVSEVSNQLEKNKREHKEFILNMLQDLEEKIKSAEIKK
jgi:chromosome segregation ATPase